MGAGEDRQSDDLDVLLQRGGHDHFRGLAKASVDDLHAGIAESARDHFGSPVVAVQTGFGDQHPDTIHSLSLALGPISRTADSLAWRESHARRLRRDYGGGKESGSFQSH